MILMSIYKINPKNKMKSTATNEPLFVPSDLIRLKGQPESPTMTVRRNEKLNGDWEFDRKTNEYRVVVDYWDSKKKCFVNTNFLEIQLEKVPETVKIE